MAKLIIFLSNLGRLFIVFMAHIGRFTLFVFSTLRYAFSPPWYLRQLISQCISIGYFSLPVVGLTAIFSGMVLALQSYVGFSRFDAENSIPTVVVLSITRELGPVLASLMVAGRIGAAIAAEIATMRVTEQIDALSTLATNPFKYLVAPRVLAGTLMVPFLVLVADIIGVLGGFLVSVYKLGFNPANYLHQTFKYLEVEDITSGLIKAAFFGFIITLMGCYQGYYSEGGAQGVGRATTNGVVAASILILIANYILTLLLFTPK